MAVVATRCASEICRSRTRQTGARTRRPPGASAQARRRPAFRTPRRHRSGVLRDMGVGRQPAGTRDASRSQSDMAARQLGRVRSTIPGPGGNDVDGYGSKTEASERAANSRCRSPEATNCLSIPNDISVTHAFRPREHRGRRASIRQRGGMVPSGIVPRCSIAGRATRAEATGET